MGICKTNAIQAYLGIFSHIWAYSGRFRHMQELFRHILAYSSCWHIQNQRYIQNTGIFRTLVYSESCCIHNSYTFRTRDIFSTRSIFRTLSGTYPQIIWAQQFYQKSDKMLDGGHSHTPKQRQYKVSQWNLVLFGRDSVCFSKYNSSLLIFFAILAQNAIIYFDLVKNLGSFLGAPSG